MTSYIYELLYNKTVFTKKKRNYEHGNAYVCLQCGLPGLIPGLGRSPGEGTGYPLQYSCLENSRDRGAWPAAVYGVTKSRTRLSN